MLLKYARRAFGAFALAGILAGLSLPAFAGIEHPKDTAAVNAVHLDMALVNKIAAVNRDLKNAPKDTQDEMEDDKDMEKDDTGTLRAPRIDTLLAKFERHPEFTAALAKHGLTGRQYLLGVYALVNGGFAVAVTKSEAEPSAAEFAKWGVNAAHYRFCKQHRAEIKQLMPD